MSIHKDQFLTDADAATWLRGVVADRRFRSALTHTSAEMTTDSTVTTEHIRGAQKFIDTLLEIGEPPVVNTPYPKIHINRDLDVPSRDIKPKQKA